MISPELLKKMRAHADVQDRPEGSATVTVSVTLYKLLLDAVQSCYDKHGAKA